MYLQYQRKNVRGNPKIKPFSIQFQLKKGWEEVWHTFWTSDEAEAKNKANELYNNPIILQVIEPEEAIVPRYISAVDVGL